MIRKDPVLAQARRHTEYESIRLIGPRTAAFMAEPALVQRAVRARLQLIIEKHQPGNRGVGAIALVTGITAAAAVLSGVISAVLAAYFAVLPRATDPDATATTVLSAILQFPLWAIFAVLVIAALIWIESGRRDRRRALASVWLTIFDEVATTAATSADDEAILQWLRKQDNR